MNSSAVSQTDDLDHGPPNMTINTDCSYEEDSISSDQDIHVPSLDIHSDITSSLHMESTHHMDEEYRRPVSCGECHKSFKMSMPYVYRQCTHTEHIVPFWICNQCSMQQKHCQHQSHVKLIWQPPDNAKSFCINCKSVFPDQKTCKC